MNIIHSLYFVTTCFGRLIRPSSGSPTNAQSGSVSYIYER